MGWSTDRQSTHGPGSPQGSPLSPVLWLIYIARTLNKADTSCKQITHTRPQPLYNLRNHYHHNLSPIRSTSSPMLMTSINPLIIKNTTSKHQEIVRKVDHILDEAAEEDELSWDPAKSTKVTFNPNSKDSSTTLGIHPYRGPPEA